MKIAGLTDIGRSRDENQDTYRSGLLPGAGAWGVVCDGMGGAQNGRLASAVAADCMEEMLYHQMRDIPEKPPAEMLTDALRLANAEVYTRSGGGLAMMGTTAVCAIIRGGRLYYAHVGDSRAYVYTKAEGLRQITRDHSMVQELVDMGTITKAEASHHPERNVITRALGVEGSVEPSFADMPIAAGDILLMCTDGLSGMVEHEGIAELLKGGPFEELPGELVAAALSAGGDDNVTVLLMQPEVGD